MCGIAGFSVGPDVDIDVSLLVKLFLAGLAERGEDACGYAYRRPGGEVEVTKRALPPHRFLAAVPVSVPHDARHAIVHVRDHTKGRPSHHGNNHPIRHGAVCGVHNGIIQNDDHLFDRHGRDRALPGMSVDSEAIFMMLDASPSHDRGFAQLVGSYSTAYFDERTPERLFVARGRGRPLVVAHGDGIVLFASTHGSIRFAARRLGLELRARSLPHATLLELRDGEEVGRRRIDVQPFHEGRTVSYTRVHENARAARRLADEHLDEAKAT